MQVPHASAFWFFSNASAASGAPLPGASTPVLVASTNVDPNPNKGLADAVPTTGGKALLAFSGPVGTMADVASSTPPDRISVYVVRPGDSLSAIASMFDVSVNTIIWANNLKGVNDVHPGDTLVILPVSGVEHTVTKKDTLKSIAKKYGVTATEIAQYNGLDTDEPLEVGALLIVPGGEIGAPSPTPSRVGSKTPPQPVRVSGPALDGFFINPLPGGILTQGIHGWNGVDIGAARGTPVYAAADGVVIVARTSGWSGGYGRYVVITHANGVQTVYGHFSSVIATPGQQVLSGQTIGYVGSSGRSTGPHLHFEVRGAENPFIHCSVRSTCAPQ